MKYYRGRGKWGGMLSVLALHTVSEYSRLRWKPPVTATLIAANALIYLRPGVLHSLLPPIDQVWFNPNLIVKYKDLNRFFLSPFYHLDESHLVYNMLSLLWKGIQLETSMGPTSFASMVLALLGLSQGMTLILAKSLLLFFDYRRAYYSEYAVGFSGVLFAMKVVLNSQSADYSNVYGVIVPSRYAAWAELVLIQMFVPGVSFLGHLGGILAGILYLRLKRSYSGVDPLGSVIRGFAGMLSWPLRRVRVLFGLRRQRISGRGRLSGVWRCPACTYDNSDSINQCEMCGTRRESRSGHVSLDELRRRRIERFGR